MTDFRKLAFVGLMSLGVATVGSASCSSSGGSSGTGGTGTSTGGTGTSTGGSHTGGSTGTGGTGTGTGGAAGATLGCAMSDVPASANIATFSGADAGLDIMGGFFVYSGTPLPTYTVSTGSVNVMDTIQTAGGPHYQGFGIYFNGNTAGTDCIDAHTYTGVQFDISGSLTGTGCSMVFSINDSEHSDSSVLKVPTDPTMGQNDPKAAGPKGSYAPQLPITSAQLTSTPTPIMVPFMGTGAPTGGSPGTSIDTTKIEGVQWQLATPTPTDGGATECVWNINISNVKFY